MAASSLTLGFLLHLTLLSLLVSAHKPQEIPPFYYEGFHTSDPFSLEVAAEVTSDRMLRLTNTSDDIVGHTFYYGRIPMLHNSSDQRRQKVSSFSTHFVFSIALSSTSTPSGFGLAFVLAPSFETLKSLSVKVRINTRLLYQQIKFNLLREESEGYAKLNYDHNG
ncbi:hypothetical protein K1719_001245 [Acacia pycnantha]|nr:hypothetical protein K1719_001245 [Acacia pycnantha]